MRKGLGTMVLTAMVILGLLVVPVTAAEYPAKPINLIVVTPPGGSFDVIGRAFASVAEKLLGQPVVVLNKVGASGLVGTIAASPVSSRRVQPPAGREQYGKLDSMGGCKQPQASFRP